MTVQSIGSTLDELADLYADDLAVVDGDTRQTFAEAIGEIRAFGTALLALGLGPGDRVAILMGERREFMTAYLGAMWAGLVTVAVSSKLGLDQHVHIVGDAAPRAIVFDDPLAVRVGEIIEQVYVPVQISADDANVWEGEHHLATQISRHDGTASAPEVDVDAPCLLAYTGGTTGLPKGIQHSHRTLLAALVEIPTEFELGSSERYAHVMPLSHAGGIMWLPIWLRGGTNVLLRGFSPSTLLDTIERERITSVVLVPTMIYALLDQPGIGERDLTSLTTVVYGAAPIGPERLGEALAVFGPVFCQFYGQAEAPALITTLSKADHLRAAKEGDTGVLRSCGSACAITEIALLDDDLQPVPEGEPGEVCVKGPHVMLGYHGDPEQTAQALAGGWLRTGDVARRDDRGLYYLVDRKKDMIISGGFNVFPKEVEQVLFAHPAVADACVIGVPDEHWGEAVKAVVVPVGEVPVSDDELIAFVRERVGALLTPKSVDFVTAIPVTPIGKHDKKRLRAEYWQEHEREIA